MKRIAISAIVLLAVAGCGDDGDSPMNGGSNGGAVTPESLSDFYTNQAPTVRAGVLDGTARLLSYTQGGSPGGVSVTPAGGNSYNVTVDTELGSALRGSSIPFFVALQGDPTDGLHDTDFPISMTIQQAQTPYGEYSASMTVTALGGGATVTIMYVQGTASLVNGERSETHEFGYELDLTFPNLPVSGWEYIEVSGSGTAAYDVCYRFNPQGGQYVRVFGEADGRTFDMEFGGQPAQGSFPCDE
ncbi:MAG TPA: hypothetical protein VKU85_19215 [bacterium]|nr:hypothetical protein [bacterium]